VHALPNLLVAVAGKQLSEPNKTVDWVT
jgi:hypothetical protein